MPIYNNTNLSMLLDKCTYRDTCSDIIKRCSNGLSEKWINPKEIENDVVSLLSEQMSQDNLYYFLADYCASKISYHPDYNKMASRICVERLHKTTDSEYHNVVEKMYNNIDIQSNRVSLVSDEFYQTVINNKDKIQNALDYQLDYQIDYFGVRTLERSYLLKSQGKIIERPQHLFMRTALFIHGNDIDKAIETYKLTSNRYFTHATPTLFNSGSKKPQGSSCFLLTMKDSINGIFHTIADCARISKCAGGIGLDMSRVRAKGSYIRGTNGKSSGIISWCKILNETAKGVDQGGKRNGSIAVYVEPWHADIYDFCELRRNTKNEDSKARDLFLALWISDIFMRRVEEDGIWSLMCPDECPNLTETYGQEFEELYENYERNKKFKKQVRARDLWFHILESQIETGTPYMLYKDSINKKSNQSNVGIVRSSNLCVHENTMILTKKGYITIKELVNKDVEIWNGEEWSMVTVKKTGTNNNLIRVLLSNGTYLDCTPEHKFYVQRGFVGKGYQEQIDAINLKNGDNLIKFNLPDAIDFEATDTTFKYPYTHGAFCGDGTTYDNYSGTKKYPKLYLYGEKQKLEEYINYTHCVYCDKTDKYTLILPKDMREKYDVPLYCNTVTKLRWFEGYCDTDGCIAKNGTNESIQIASINKDFLIKVRYMLHTIGIESKITLFESAHKKMLPDGHGNQKEYDCKEAWRLLVSSSGLYKLAMLGFSPKRLEFTIREPNRNAEQFIKVIKIEQSYQNVDTYCFTEPKRHMGMFNGILTGQCSEITEVTSDDEIAVCNLASICLPRFVENGEFNFTKLMEVSKVATYNLNNLIDKNYYPVEQAKRSNLRHRPIGVGVQGLADVYNIMGYSFGSEESNILNKKIFETIYFGTLTASNEIAKLTGSYETFKGSPFSKGILQFHSWGKTEEELLMGYDWKKLIEDIKISGTKNSLLTSLMPTASTSQIMGNCESFEPYLSNIFTRSTLAGEFIVVNQNLVNDLLKLNLWSSEMRDKIIIYGGSVQQIDEIPTHIKEVYKTAFEIKQKSIVQQSVDRGCFVDQSQSLNLFIGVPDYKKLSSSHFYGWKNGLKTGMYYLRSQPSINPIKFGIDIDFVNKVLGKKHGKKIMYRKKRSDNKSIDIEQKKDTRSYLECEMCSS